LGWVSLMVLEEKVFKDPIHGYIRVRDELIWALIQTPEFQRLRRIKQLGGTQVVYPTAEHSRFSHSLGVYEITRRIIGTLDPRAEMMSVDTRILLLAAALLHDLGHGPFSHSFESVLDVNHEDFTVRIILEDTEINRLLETYQAGLAKEVADVILKRHENLMVINLISSQLDADRLDYLLRDAYFTGTPYGEIDLDRILRTIRVHDKLIVYKESGMHVIEDYLLSRYQMFWQVYAHDCSRSFNFIIQSLLMRVRDLISSGHKFKCDVVLFERLFEGDIDVSIKTYLRFDDGVITTFAASFAEEDDAILRDLADRFLNRRLFKEFDFSGSEMSEKFLKWVAIGLTDLGYDPKYYIFRDEQQRTLYDYYRYDEDSKKEPINLLMRSGKIREISEVSDVIRGIVNIAKEKKTVFLPLDFMKKCHDDESFLNMLGDFIV